MNAADEIEFKEGFAEEFLQGNPIELSSKIQLYKPLALAILSVLGIVWVINQPHPDQFTQKYFLIAVPLMLVFSLLLMKFSNQVTLIGRTVVFKTLFGGKNEISMEQIVKTKAIRFKRGAYSLLTVEDAHGKTSKKLVINNGSLFKKRKAAADAIELAKELLATSTADQKEY